MDGLLRGLYLVGRVGTYYGHLWIGCIMSSGGLRSVFLLFMIGLCCSMQRHGQIVLWEMARMGKDEQPSQKACAPFDVEHGLLDGLWDGVDHQRGISTNQSLNLHFTFDFAELVILLSIAP